MKDDVRFKKKLQPCKQKKKKSGHSGCFKNTFRNFGLSPAPLLSWQRFLWWPLFSLIPGPTSLSSDIIKHELTPAPAVPNQRQTMPGLTLILTQPRIHYCTDLGSQLVLNDTFTVSFCACKICVSAHLFVCVSTITFPPLGGVLTSIMTAAALEPMNHSHHDTEICF